MQDAFAARGDQIQQRLLDREQTASDTDLFPLGYMIPQIELVLERADYKANEVTAEDFDVTYWGFLEQAFVEDGMSIEDKTAIERLWHDVSHT